MAFSTLPRTAQLSAQQQLQRPYAALLPVAPALRVSVCLRETLCSAAGADALSCPSSSMLAHSLTVHALSLSPAQVPKVAASSSPICAAGAAPQQQPRRASCVVPKVCVSLCAAWEGLPAF